MILIGAKHVEELKARPLRWARRTLGQKVGYAAVEQILAATIKIEWLERCQSSEGAVIVET